MDCPQRVTQLRSYFERYAKDVHDSLDFLEWIEKQMPQLEKPTVLWEQDLFRILYGGYDPLAVAGSLAAGGRFNIGGAQVNQFFPHFSMQAALYGASSRQCALQEAGEPRGMTQEYALTPKKALHLWDVEALLATKLPYPHLKEQIDATPLAARWQLQKVPKISQILAHHLRKAGGDGLIYPSTKHKEGKIVALFAKDDAEMKKGFQVKRLEL